MFCLLVGVSSLFPANKLYSPRQNQKTSFSLKLARPPAQKNKFSQPGKPFHSDKQIENSYLRLELWPITVQNDENNNFELITPS